jgi:hypothetical protein
MKRRQRPKSAPPLRWRRIHGPPENFAFFLFFYIFITGDNKIIFAVEKPRGFETGL